jgi:signal transduction histidine kinase
MESLIEGLLQLSRVGRQELVLTDVDLNELLAEVMDLLHPRLEQTHTTVEVDGPLPTIQADRVRLQEVFNNLLTNAIKYSDQAEKTVVVGSAPAGMTVPGAADSSAYHVFYVQDFGIGIDPKHHESIFKLFKRLHAQEKYGGGTGAGLAIAKKMVEKHGGRLWVDSALGHGATFYFALPKELITL